MKIYLAHPISGRAYDEVVEYYLDLTEKLWVIGYEPLHPMTAKGYLRNEIEFKTTGYDNPVSTNHAIKERDQWMIAQSDIVLMDLTGATRVSIGCMMELAYADDGGKHTIVIMEADNIHRHAFVLEAADIVFRTLDEAIDYLHRLMRGAT